MKKILCIILTVFMCVVALPSMAQTSPRFNHLTVYVVDLQKSADFYEKVMMLEKIAEPFHDNRHVWFKMTEHGQLHVVSGAAAVTQHDINIHLAFSVPSIQDFMKHLDAMNVKYGNYKGDAKGPQVRPDGINQIYFQDPDGYWIEVNDDKF